MFVIARAHAATHAAGAAATQQRGGGAGNQTMKNDEKAQASGERDIIGEFRRKRPRVCKLGATATRRRAFVVRLKTGTISRSF